MLQNLLQNNSIKNKYKTLIYEINAYENSLKILDDDDLRDKTFQLKNFYRNKNDLTEITAEAFAIVREASRRTLGLRHFDVQLLGGLVLNSGKIAEMRTGEGKTLVATAPAYLNGLTEKGVHIVTVNEYLANRDQTVMSQVYSFLGLSTGLIQENMTTKNRQENYNADITYVTNNELGFDYLRDNMVPNITELVQKPFNFCIIDEIDSVLIDEAQTPLIIANPIKTCIDKYIIAAELAEYLEINVHFQVDEKNNSIILTSEGTKIIEKILGIQDLYNPNDPWIPYILNAVKANALVFRNIQYLVQNNQIIIVDEFTGRIMPERRWSDGLHQAIEAKEGLPVRQNTETSASITYQNFFLVYPKLSGMTGTAKTAEVEFDKIYNLPVIEIPVAKSMKRKDFPDRIYKDELSKWKAIARECKQIQLKNQPILIGTTTVEKSEMLAQLLNEYNLNYQILNAKPENVRKEAEIVAQAGEKNSITIATNMAGRGTDIILGGNIVYKIRKQLYQILTSIKNKKNSKIFSFFKEISKISQRSLSILITLKKSKEFRIFSDIEILKKLNKNDLIKFPNQEFQYSIKFLINESFKFERKTQRIENLIVKNLGGLYIIGTERNDSRRIDNQLRGRCGRQGDPGSSRFFLSIEDKILRLFGNPKMEKTLKDQLLDDLPFESELVTQILDSAQTKIEEKNYDVRKGLFEYDDILNKQRNVIYFERKKIIEIQSIQTKIIAYGEQIITEILLQLKNNIYTLFYLNLIINDLLYSETFINFYDKILNLKNKNFNLLKNLFFQEFWLIYEMKIMEFEIQSINLIDEFAQMLILYYMDIEWKEHLQKMVLLRDAVRWRRYGQRNPLFEYKEEAYRLFKFRNLVTRRLIIYELLNSRIL